MLVRYERLAIAWDSESNARKRNKIFDELHELELALRSHESGREGLERLLAHANRGVRLKAAGACLAWGSQAAEAALEALVSPESMHSFSAEMTLQEYRAGRMRFDW